MEQKVKNNILFIALDEKFGEDVSKSIADDLSMHYAGAKALINYDLFNSSEVLTQCGESYYLQREKVVIKSICNYDNTLIFTNYDIFIHNKETFSKDSMIIYLRLPKRLLSKEEKINIIAFESRDEELINKTDMCADLRTTDRKAAMRIIYRYLGGL